MKPINLPLNLSNQALVTALLILLLAAQGCAHRRGGNSASSRHGQETGQADPFGTWSDAGFAGGDAENVPLTGRPNDVRFDSAQVRKDLFEPVYFAFDHYEVAANEMQKIKQLSNHLRSRAAGVIVAGHTDLTGTAEYNRNLGERRALAIRAALLQLGVHPSQVQTLSFGEDRPAQSGNNESAHAANRRAEFGVFESVSP